MVRLVPSNYEVFPNRSDGEQELYSALKNSPAGSNWVVLHSLEIAKHVKQVQGEADFVVLAPGLGVLVLEVKAARSVERLADGWRLGNEFSKKGPFKQASEAKHSIMKHLGVKGVDTYKVPFVHAVWFTHLPRKDIPSSIEWTDTQLLTKEDKKLDIVEVMARRIADLTDELGISFPAQRASVEDLRKIEDALSPKFIATQAPADRKQEIQRFLDLALDEQKNRAKLVLSLPRVMLRGLAGTGKTFIALHAAREAQERGETTLFVCYNGALAKELKAQLADSQQVKVTSLHSLMLEVAEVEPPQGQHADWWAKKLPEIALSKVEQASNRYKFARLIMDEGQDIGTDEYLLFLDALMLNGLKGSNLLVCGDFEHQDLFADGQECLANITAAVPDLVVPEPLAINCRNTIEVGQFVQAYLELEPGYEDYRKDQSDGSADIIPLKGDEQIPSAVATTLKKLLLRYEPGDIVVLSTARQALGAVMEHLKQESTPIRVGRANTIRWGTIQEFKGLEAFAIVHVEFDEPAIASLESVYVGGTRSLNDYVWIVPNAARERINSL